jgi:hypothetical protein
MHINQVWMFFDYSHRLRSSFINDAIKYLTDHFLMKHVSSTTYYYQKNGQAKSTIKVLGHC